MEMNSNGVGKFLDPGSIISQLDVSPGNVAVDFGCGPGYFSIPFARKVGESGKVFSLDVLPQALESVEGKAKLEGLSNIKTQRVNLEKENGSRLETESADWVIMKDILFQNKKKDAIIAEAYRVLKPGGKAIVVEWNQDICDLSDKKEPALAIGPDCAVRIPQNELEKMFAEKKFTPGVSVDAGKFHYAFVAIK